MKMSIIGIGTIGSKLAIYLMSMGIQVCCITTKDSNVVKERLWNLIKKRNLDLAFDKEVIQVSNNYSIAHGSDLIIDATAENYDIKETVYRRIKEQVEGKPMIATTTSSLNIEKLSDMAKPLKLMGLHFFNPPDKMKLVEVSYQEESKDIAELIVSKLKNLCTDKQFIIMPLVQGYICNRILFVYLNAAFNYHLSTGISFSDIDMAMEMGTNVPMGPFRLSDYIGNDISLSILEQFYSELEDEQYRPSLLIKQIVSNGKLGRKVKEGFYKYE